MSDYVDFATSSVFEDSGDHRIFVGKFYDAEDLQSCLKVIKNFDGYKHPKKYTAVIKRYQKETGREIIY